MKDTVTAFILLTVVWETTCSIQVKGFVGGGLLIKCKFDERYKNKTKYFCKGEENKSPYERLNQDVDNRIKEFNFKDEGLFVVYIKQLAMKDSGKYLCAVENEDKHTEVEINIKEADNCCYQPVARTSHMGENVNLSCKYPQESRGNTKYFCKQQHAFSCSNLIPEKAPFSGKRFSVTDHVRQNTFTVHISNISSRDSGTYWCGVRTGSNTGSVALLTEVHLTVQDPDVPNQPPSPSPVDSTLVIGVCLTLAVLILAFAIFMYLRRKHNKTSNHLATKTSKETKEASTDRDYEEIVSLPFTAQRTNPQEEDRSADVCDASDLSDGPNYVSVHFHRNPEQQSRGGTTAPLQTEGAVVHTEDTACEYASIKHQC